MRKVLGSMFAVLMLAGCTGIDVRSVLPEQSQEITKKISYLKDSRPKIPQCFAVVSSVSHATYVIVSIANVRCEEVSNMLTTSEPRP